MVATLNKIKDAEFEGIKPTLVTPEMAADWLAKYYYERQRSLRMSKVAYYKSIIEDGTFEPTPITFALCEETDGIILVDGQHRLSAIVQADTPAFLYVITREIKTIAEVHALYGRLDRGAMRSSSDVLRAHGVQEDIGISQQVIQRLAPAGSFITTDFVAGGNSLWSQSGDMRVSFIYEWADEIRAYANCLEGTGSPRNSLVSAPVAAVALVTLRYQREKAELFWRSVAENDGLRKGTPEHTLRAYLWSGPIQKLGRNRVSRATAFAWNAYFQGRTISLLKVFDERAPIFIAGTPYKGR